MSLRSHREKTLRKYEEARAAEALSVLGVLDAHLNSDELEVCRLVAEIKSRTSACQLPGTVAVHLDGLILFLNRRAEREASQGKR